MKLLGRINQSKLIIQFLLFWPFKKSDFLIFSIAAKTEPKPYSFILAFNSFNLFPFMLTIFEIFKEFHLSLIVSMLFDTYISLDILLFLIFLFSISF